MAFFGAKLSTTVSTTQIISFILLSIFAFFRTFSHKNASFAMYAIMRYLSTLANKKVPKTAFSYGFENFWRSR